MINQILNFSKKLIIRIITSVVSSIITYYLLDEELYSILKPLFPFLPNIPILIIILSMIAFSLQTIYYAYKSVLYHRKIEKIVFDLIEFLKKWDELIKSYHYAIEDNTNETIQKFEDVRTDLIYSYHSIKHIILHHNLTMIDYTEKIQVNKYDFIGNLLQSSPFIESRMFSDIINREYFKNLDRGRTLIVASLGEFNPLRSLFYHKLYQIFHLVPNLVKN